jgi:hypothetical protein
MNKTTGVPLVHKDNVTEEDIEQVKQFIEEIELTLAREVFESSSDLENKYVQRLEVALINRHFFRAFLYHVELELKRGKFWRNRLLMDIFQRAARPHMRHILLPHLVIVDWQKALLHGDNLNGDHDVKLKSSMLVQLYLLRASSTSSSSSSSSSSRLGVIVLLLPYEIRLSIQDYIFPWKEGDKKRNKRSFGYYTQGYFESLVARQQQQQQQQQQFVTFLGGNNNQHLHVNPFEDEEEEEEREQQQQQQQQPVVYFEPGGVRGWRRF